MDNWSGRQTGMLCRTCVFYVKKGSEELKSNLGRCRRRAPTLNRYPVVFPDDWCGDHKLDENKDAGNP